MNTLPLTNNRKENINLLIPLFLQMKNDDIQKFVDYVGYHRQYLIEGYLKNDELILENFGEKVLRQVKTKLNALLYLEHKRNIEKICNQFLENDSYDLKNFINQLGYSGKKAFLRALKNKEGQIKYLSPTMLKQVIQKVDQCNAFTRKKAEDFKQQQQISKLITALDLLVNHPYGLGEVNQMLHTTFTVEKIVNQYETLMGEKLDKEIIKFLQEKKYRQQRHQYAKENKAKVDAYQRGITLTDERDIQLVKDSICIVTNEQYKILKTIQLFLQNQKDIQKVIQITGKNYNSIYTDLTVSSLDKLVKPEILEEIQKAIQVENILLGHNGSFREKKRYITYILESFQQNNYSLEQTEKATGIDIVFICRVLKDDFINILLKNKEQVEAIQKIVSQYEENIEKEKEY